MATIELTCPSCASLLELDEGFAGGVCRCSDCGALMTVPAAKDTGESSSSRRPDSPVARPDSPVAARPSEPTAAPVEPAGATEPGPAPAAADARAAKPPADEVGTPAPAETATLRPAQPTAATEPEVIKETVDEQGRRAFVTASGRTIGEEVVTNVPIAKKKRVAVRAMTAVVFGGFVLLVVILCIVAILIVAGPPSESSRYSNVLVEQFAFDPNVNPLTLEKPNILGLSLGTKTVIVVDASQASAGYLDLVKQAAVAGLTRGGSNAQINLFYAGGDEVRSLYSSMGDLESVTESKLASLHENVKPTGQWTLPVAIKRAVEQQPNQIILVTGQRPSFAEAEAISKSIEPLGEAYVDVAAIDIDSVDLDDLTLKYGGRFARIRLDDLKQWSKAKPEHKPE